MFSKTEVSIARMLQGYGLHQTALPPDYSDHNVTIVESIWTKSVCPITDTRCWRQARIVIQSEQLSSTLRYVQQYLAHPIRACCESPNCIIFEFSEYNYKKLRKSQSVEDSIVLLPVMTQSPSRLFSFLPKVRKEMKERLYDIVFFGSMTSRRREHLPGLLQSYLKEYPDRSLVISNDHNQTSIAKAYKEAKICLVLHSYSRESGGEYHRMSEIAPFGCIPVMESFSDGIGVPVYESCGGVVFADVDNLANTAIDVIRKIEGGHYDRLSEVTAWWEAGILWEHFFPTVFP